MVNHNFARLVLNERDIYPFTIRSDYYPLNTVIEQPRGRIAIGNSQVTWLDVGLKQCMGSLWGEYDLYAIELAQFHTAPYTLGNSGQTFPNPYDVFNRPERQNMTVYMSGLDWVNSSYNVAVGNNQSRAVIASISNYRNMDTNGLNGNWSNFDPAGTIATIDGAQITQISPMFFRPREHVNITIQVSPTILGRPLNETDDSFFAGNNNIFPQYCVFFNIYGVIGSEIA